MSSIERSYAALSFLSAVRSLGTDASQPSLRFSALGRLGWWCRALDPGVAEGHCEIELQQCTRVRLDRDAPHEAARRHVHGWAVDAELGLAMHLAEAPAEQQAVLAHLQRVLALAARSTLLDGEDVGEVGGHLQFDDRRDHGRPPVLRNSICSCQTEPSCRRRTTSRRGSVWLAGMERPTNVRAAGVDQADCERLDGDATDQQPSLAEHTHVGEEHSVGGVGAEVTGTTTEAERLTIDQGDEPGGISETRRLAGEHPWARLGGSAVHGSTLLPCLSALTP